MTFQARSTVFSEDVEAFDGPVHAAPFAANDDAPPGTGWATRNPDQAMLFLFVSPRDGAMVDELMAL